MTMTRVKCHRRSFFTQHLSERMINVRLELTAVLQLGEQIFADLADLAAVTHIASVWALMVEALNSGEVYFTDRTGLVTAFLCLNTHSFS